MSRIRYTFALPVLLAGAVGGFIGWTVSRVGCSGAGCSLVTNLIVGLLSGLIAAAGVGIVVVLADRSLREWNEWRLADQEDRNGVAPDSAAGQD